jgi:AcrR family transcriptional regulator
MRQPLTRDAISRAARELLVSEGLQAVSLRRVAAMLGVTAPALYAHVVDKRDLLQGIAEQEVGGLIERSARISADDPLDRLYRQACDVVDWAAENADLFRALFLYRPELTAESVGERPPLAARLRDALGASLREAMAAGRLDERDAQEGALVLWTAVQGVATVLLSGPPVDPDVRERLARVAVATVLRGMGGEVGLLSARA